MRFMSLIFNSDILFEHIITFFNTIQKERVEQSNGILSDLARESKKVLIIVIFKCHNIVNQKDHIVHKITTPMSV